MRTETPISTCSRITLCAGSSATALSISTPRFIGPGCITSASGAARASFSASRPKKRKYSRALGTGAAPPPSPMRSRCRRSIITTSTPSRPRAMSWNTSTPRRPTSAGSSVGGPTTRTRLPIVPSRWMLDRATRLCATSPQIATVSPASRPRLRRIVSASSSAWVGCSWVPSPALTTAAPTFCASSDGAPDCPWRTTSRSQCIAFSVAAVSSRVSPLFTLELATDMLMTSAPRRLPASSKLVRVRVLSSKNRLMTVRPRRVSRCVLPERFSRT